MDCIDIIEIVISLDCRKHDHYFKTISDRTDIKHIE